jgi:hypothetical protein
MKKIWIMAMVLVVAVLAACAAPASAFKVPSWAKIDEGYAHEILSDTSSGENTFKMTNILTRKVYSIDLGKGDIWVYDVRFDYESNRVSLWYKFTGKAESKILVAWISNTKMEVFRINISGPFWITGFEIFGKKVFVSVIESNRKGNTVRGEIRVYDIPHGSYKVTVQYEGSRGIIWGEERYGWDETFQRGVLVGLIEPAKYSGSFDWSKTSATVYNADNGSVVKKFTISANTKVKWFYQLFPGDGTYTFELREAAERTRKWEGVEEE